MNSPNSSSIITYRFVWCTQVLFKHLFVSPPNCLQNECHFHFSYEETNQGSEIFSHLTTVLQLISQRAKSQSDSFHLFTFLLQHP